MKTIYLGLGSNLGDREKNIREAVRCLNQAGIPVEKLSTIIETNPVGGPPQGKFLNAVAQAKTQLPPEDLLKKIKRIEKDLGRLKAVMNGPRVIDIDILLYGNQNIKTPELTIPHPRMYERDFVLVPLKEIAPHFFRDSVYANN